MPGGMAELCQRAWRLAGASETYRIGMIEVLAYSVPGGFLEPHVDAVYGHAVIISVGATAHFWWSSAAHTERKVVELRSGDAVVFPSSLAAAVKHGITHFEPGTTPSWMSKEHARICVQYREELPHQG